MDYINVVSAEDFENLEKTEDVIRKFNSLSEEYIFYLLELRGEERLNKLKVSQRHFKNRAIATNWKNKIEKEIKLETSNISGAKEAINKLNELYELMISR